LHCGVVYSLHFVIGSRCHLGQHWPSHGLRLAIGEPHNQLLSCITSVVSVIVCTAVRVHGGHPSVLVHRLLNQQNETELVPTPAHTLLVAHNTYTGRLPGPTPSRPRVVPPRLCNTPVTALLCTISRPLGDTNRVRLRKLSTDFNSQWGLGGGAGLGWCQP
jgi:hypothetical protein